MSFLLAGARCVCDPATSKHTAHDGCCGRIGTPTSNRSPSRDYACSTDIGGRSRHDAASEFPGSAQRVTAGTVVRDTHGHGWLTRGARYGFSTDCGDIFTRYMYVWTVSRSCIRVVPRVQSSTVGNEIMGCRRASLADQIVSSTSAKCT